MLDEGAVYIPIDKDITKDEMKKLKSQYPNKMVVLLRSGNKDIKTVLSELIRASLKS